MVDHHSIVLRNVLGTFELRSEEGRRDAVEGPWAAKPTRRDRAILALDMEWARSRGFRDALQIAAYLAPHHLTLVVERVAASLGESATSPQHEEQREGHGPSSASATHPFSEHDFHALCRKVYNSMRKRHQKGEEDASTAEQLSRLLRLCEVQEEEGTPAEADGGDRKLREGHPHPPPPSVICERVRSMMAAIKLTLQSAAFYGLKPDKLRSVLLGEDGGEAACREHAAGVIADVWRAHGRGVIAKLGESDASWIADRLVRTDWRVELDVARSGSVGDGQLPSSSSPRGGGFMEAKAVIDLLIRRPPSSAASCEGDKRITLSMNEAETERLFHQLNAIQTQIDALE